MQGYFPGDKDTAKTAISKMRLLSLGASSDSEEGEELVSALGLQKRLGRIRSNLSVLKSGNRYIIRKQDKGLTVELGR